MNSAGDAFLAGPRLALEDYGQRIGRDSSEGCQDFRQAWSDVQVASAGIVVDDGALDTNNDPPGVGRSTTQPCPTNS